MDILYTSKIKNKKLYIFIICLHLNESKEIICFLLLVITQLAQLYDVVACTKIKKNINSTHTISCKYKNLKKSSLKNGPKSLKKFKNNYFKTSLLCNRHPHSAIYIF